MREGDLPQLHELLSVGRGTAALQGLLDWAEANTTLELVLGVTDPDNESSARMMLAVGVAETFENAEDGVGGDVPARTLAWRRPEA
jgi:RimJ/RimL family protein N-acetyltransferase